MSAAITVGTAYGTKKPTRKSLPNHDRARVDDQREHERQDQHDGHLDDHEQRDALDAVGELRCP